MTLALCQSELRAPEEVVGAAHDPCRCLEDGTRQSLSFFSDLPAGCRVLDVGCGEGVHLRALAARGCEVVGVDCNAVHVHRLRREGYQVLQGTAEVLPMADESVDAIVCSVVLPYTDERQSIAEWSRVLRGGGEVRASYHGLGYALRQLCGSAGARGRLYGARTIVNSVVYRTFGRRLPGFLGDTIYQSRKWLRRYYSESQLMLQREYIRWSSGLPDIVFHALIKGPLST